jgi:hypothetical protein
MKRSVRWAYMRSAKEAFERAVEAKYGAQGAASGVRRIDPSTGQPIISDAEIVRQNIGADCASRP